MRFEHRDSSLWFGTDDAPAPLGRVAEGSCVTLAAAVQPIDARNRVEVRFKTGDDSVHRSVSARWERTDHSAGVQYFRAEFPRLAMGERVRYSVVCLGPATQVPEPSVAESYPASFTIGTPRVAGGNPIATTGSPVVTTGSPVVAAGAPVVATASSPCTCTSAPVSGHKAKFLQAASAPRHHAVLDALRDYGAFETGNTLGDHHCVVVGSRDATGELAREAFAKNRGVLVLDPSEQVKRAMCERFVGCGLGGASAAYFLQRHTPHRVRLVELPTDGWEVVRGETTSGPSDDAEEPLVLAPSRWEPLHPETLDRFVTHLFDSFQTTRVDLGGDIPPEVKHLQVHATASGSVTHDSQVSHLDLNFDAIAFLNSPPHGTPNQILFLETSALAYPGKQLDYTTWTKGWIQNRLELSSEISGQPSGLFGLFGHTPKNTAKETSVTTSLGFNVNYSNGTFEFSRSKTETIKDWEVIDRSHKVKAAWTYAQMDPFPAVGDIKCCADPGCPFTFWDHAAGYGTLSRYTLTAETMASWRTTEVTRSVVDLWNRSNLRLGHYHSKLIKWTCSSCEISAGKSIWLDFSKIAD